jgi:hypothetical protein
MPALQRWVQPPMKSYRWQTFHPEKAGYSDMTKLALIVDQIKSEITVDAEGKGKASIRAVARLMDVDHAGLLGNLKSGEQKSSKLAEMLMESGFDSGEQSSWSETGIPDLAIAIIAKYYAYKAGRYCKKQAELVDTAFTGIGVRSWMQQQVGWKKCETPQQPQEPLPVDSIRDVVLAVYGHTGIDKYLLASAIANEIGKQRPEYKALTDSIKEDIPGVKVEDKLVRPGKLAEIYEAKTGIKLSAQKINNLLSEKGLQIKNPSGKNPSWLPTEQGKEYSQMMMDAAKGHNKTVQSLQWYPSVVELI